MRLSHSIVKIMCCAVLPGCAADPAGTGSPPAGAVPANDPNIQYSGRFDFTDPLAPRFDWPAVSLSTMFQGTSIGILLTDGSNDYDAFIDGVPGQVIVTGSTGQYTVGGLGSGTHAFQLVKRTEASYGIATFHGFVLEAGTALLPPSPAPSRRIEFVGDSLACGYGDESLSSSCAANQRRALENSWLAYGPLTARALGAECRVTSAGGTGLVHNYGDPNPVSAVPMPALYARTLENSPSPNYDFTQWIPDAVVVFLGGNDFLTTPYPSQTDFQDGYTKFIALLRANYSAVRIFCVSFFGETMESYVSNVVAAANAAGDANVQFVEMHYPSDQLTGCDSHPNLTGQQQMANELAPAVQTAMGW